MPNFRAALTTAGSPSAWNNFDAPVGEIMTSNVRTAAPSETVNHCMEVMTVMKIRHLPVVEDGTVVGMISIGDLVQAIIVDQKEEIEHLEHYISGQ